MFREKTLEDVITQGHLFIACDNEKIIGYKKLYLFNNKQEKEKTLQDELCCLGKDAECTYAGIIDQNGKFIQNANRFPSINAYKICIYNGSDFTLDSYRGKGVNQGLTGFALSNLFEGVQRHLNEQKSTIVSMVYGITESNAGKEPGIFPDRTISIAKSYKDFLYKFEQNNDPITLEHYRYTAYMPTFDPEGTECIPLPQTQAIKGFGCVLMYTLKDKKQ